MKTFRGKAVFLTGAASGIGKALAQALAAEGCDLALVDVNEDGLRALANELQAQNVRVDCFRCDLSKPDEIEGCVASAVKAFGGFDILINNAGVAYYGPTEHMTRQQWDWLMNINLISPIEITRLLLPVLLTRPEPHIVNMCSVSGLVAGGRFAAYHTSKFGLIGFTEAIRAEYGRKGVGVSAICPGPVTTGLYKSAANSRSDKSVPEPPRWLCATPEQVAKRTLKAIRSNKRQVLITPLAHLLFQLKRFAPWLIDFANQFSRNGRRKRLAQVAAQQALAAQAQAAQSQENTTSERRAA
ncbi:MAG: SDR family oxidoreductase [Planctomycetaceae bacterium]|nr:SDR family oxidoreductase [Planctomycetaceae bacterium]